MSKLIIDQPARDKIKTDLNTNFLVEAGAGSGKTTSLVDRMVNLIHTGTSQIGEIVAITFTRKAADELKVRFQSELEKAWKRETDLDAKNRLAVALQNIERCFLGTVHSFCAKLLRERPIEANLDLNFKELEETDDIEILEEAWQFFLQVLNDERSPLLDEMEELGISTGDLFLCFKEMKEYPDVEWITVETDRPELASSYQSLMRIVKEAKKSVPEKEPDKGYDSLQKAILNAVQKDRFNNPLKDKDIMEVLELFNKNLKPTYNRWPSKEDAKFYEEKITTFVQMTVKPLIQKWREYCHPKIVYFLKQALNGYEILKKERSLLNFQDLLINTAKLLRDSAEVRNYFQYKYRFLLIDEFQDTDPIQAEIMFYLTSENKEERVWTKCTPKPGSLFVVGDPKQAIYRFRRADIDTYNRVKQLIESHGGEVLQLTMNFRTLDSITNELNKVFEHHLPEEETIYQAAYRPLNSFHQDLGESYSGIKRISVPAEYTKKDEVVLKDAENIGFTIKHLLQDGYKAKDFLVLTRYTDGIATYAQTIEDLGIPVSISGEIVIGETKEFQELFLLLNTFLDPTDEVSLLAVLRGVFFGFSDEELYQWRQVGGGFSIYSAIPADLKPEIKVKFESALSKLQKYQKWIRTYSPTIAIEFILEDIGFYPLLLKNRRNKRTYKSLLQILEGLRKHEMDGSCTFKHIHQRLFELTYEKTVVVNIEEDADAVRVMNVHKAKGLEAPIVFLTHPIKSVKPESFLSKHIKREDQSSKGYFCFSVRNGFQDKDLGFPIEWEIHKQEELRYLIEEEMRIIYVAATRAEKALIISSSAKSNNKNPWNALLEIEDLADIEVATIEKPEGTQKIIQLSLADFQVSTNGKMSWLETSKSQSYNHWTPTKNKDFSQIAIMDREEGGGKSWGTMIHDVFEKAIKGVEVTNYVKGALTKYELPSEREQEVLDAISTFKNSDIWQELQTAELVLTEVPFTLKVNENDPLYESVRDSQQAKHPIFIKGIIDLVYKFNGGWVIVDYKTDRPTNESDLKQLQDFYGSQISFYKKAWEELTNERVIKERLFFTNAPNIIK